MAQRESRAYFTAQTLNSAVFYIRHMWGWELLDSLGRYACLSTALNWTNIAVSLYCVELVITRKWFCIVRPLNEHSLQYYHHKWLWISSSLLLRRKRLWCLIANWCLKYLWYLPRSTDLHQKYAFAIFFVPKKHISTNQCFLIRSVNNLSHLGYLKSWKLPYVTQCILL